MKNLDLEKVACCEKCGSRNGYTEWGNIEEMARFECFDCNHDTILPDEYQPKPNYNAIDDMAPSMREYFYPEY